MRMNEEAAVEAIATFWFHIILGGMQFHTVLMSRLLYVD